MLRINDINVSIANIKILTNISIDINKFTSVIGRNGAGKTTLVRSIMGILQLDSGNIKFNKNNLSNYNTSALSSFGIGYMPEDRRLIPNLSVKENILLPLWCNNISNENDELEKILNFIPEIKAFLKSDAYQLSGGQQKLVALARAMIVGTNLLILDEPFEGVAPALAERLVELIVGLNKLQLIAMITESDETYSKIINADIVNLERGRIVS